MNDTDDKPHAGYKDVTPYHDTDTDLPAMGVQALDHIRKSLGFPPPAEAAALIRQGPSVILCRLDVYAATLYWRDTWREGPAELVCRTMPDDGRVAGNCDAHTPCRLCWHVYMSDIGGAGRAYPMRDRTASEKSVVYLDPFQFMHLVPFLNRKDLYDG